MTRATPILRSIPLLIQLMSVAIIVGFWHESDPPAPDILRRGQALYHSTCAPCHGKEGKGDGRIAANLDVKPRDFTRGVYENRSTMTGQLPTKSDLFKTLSEGIHRSAMPHFRGFTTEDRAAVVEYIRTLSPRFVDPDEYPLTVLPDSPIPEFTHASLFEGRRIYIAMKCADCHGATGKGEGEVVKKQFDEFGKQIATPDLTDPSSYEFSRSLRDVYRILSTGLDGSSMPSYYTAITDTERWHLSYYIWSLRDGQWFAFDSTQNR